MTEYLGATKTAKVVRKILKEKFPTIKFSVRSESYSMGCSVRVNWTDGPTTKQVDQAVGVLAGSGFDGSIDLKYSITHWLNPDGSFTLANSQGTQGSMGYAEPFHFPKPYPDSIEVMFADHISPSRSYSKGFMEAVVKATSEKFGGEIAKIEGSDKWGYYIHCMDYNQDRLYGVILQSSVIKHGKVVCFDHLYGSIMNKTGAAQASA